MNGKKKLNKNFIYKKYNRKSNYISKQKLEKPIIPQLTKICENIVIDLFRIPSETINLSCKLVQKIEPTHAINLLPEDREKYKQ